MKIKNIELFPLAKTLVELQQKKLGFIIDNLIIVNSKIEHKGNSLIPHCEKNRLETVGGSYNNETNTIMLNMGSLAFLRNKYGYNTKNIMRVAAAIVFEECYHAAHYGTAIDNEDLAVWYGSSEAAKLPEEMLTINQKEEKEKMKLKDIPVTVVSGGMFKFVNAIASMNATQDSIKTTYGELAIKKERDNAVTTVAIKTDPAILERMAKILGNVTNASIEYAGMVYIYDKKEGWKSYVDIDDKDMVEIDMKDTVEAKLSTEGEEPCLEIKAG